MGRSQGGECVERTTHEQAESFKLDAQQFFDGKKPQRIIEDERLASTEVFDGSSGPTSRLGSLEALDDPWGSSDSLPALHDSRVESGPTSRSGSMPALHGPRSESGPTSRSGSMPALHGPMVDSLMQ